MKNWIFGGAGGASAAADFGLMILRIMAGLGLSLGHGIKKLPPSDSFIRGVEGLGMPGVMAWAATGAEFAGGILLALGLFTRPSAFFILITMGVAFFGVHLRDPFAKQELSLFYGAAAILFLLAGPGRFAVDRLIKK